MKGREGNPAKRNFQHSTLGDFFSRAKMEREKYMDM